MPAKSAMPAAAGAPAVHVLSARLADVPPGGDLPGLADFLALVPDHRRAQGVRHSLVSVLCVACAAVAAGAKSLVAIAEWAADAPVHVLEGLGVRRDRCGGALVPPSETTIRRTLRDTDPAALDEQLSGWSAAMGAADGAGQGQEAGGEPLVQVMVDGKSLRGAVQPDGRAVHLLAAMTGDCTVLAQRDVEHKTNEITQVRSLLDPLGLAGTVITLDALHCQRDTARYIVADKHADDIFTAVKDNQPKLFEALDALPWTGAQVTHLMHDRGHGRDETRTIQVLPVPDGLFPHAAQAFLIERHVTDLRGNPVSDIAALGITSMSARRGTPAVIATAVRGHWAIENKLHYVRDVTCGEDASRVRTGSAPQKPRRHAQHDPARAPRQRMGQHRRRAPLGQPRLPQPTVTATTRYVRTPSP